jgi:hypothetical protein
LKTLDMQLDMQMDALEAAYEQLLEYAAQGREDAADMHSTQADTRSDIAARIVVSLRALASSLESIADLLDDNIPFHQVVSEDISRVRAALTLISTAPRLSSELIDNLIASVHMKAVLTDLFLISEINRMAAES